MDNALRVCCRCNYATPPHTTGMVFGKGGWVCKDDAECARKRLGLLEDQAHEPLEKEIHVWGMTAEQVQHMEGLEKQIEALGKKTTERFRKFCWPVSDGSGFKSEKPRYQPEPGVTVYRTITYKCKWCFHEHTRCENMGEDT